MCFCVLFVSLVTRIFWNHGIFYYVMHRVADGCGGFVQNQFVCHFYDGCLLLWSYFMQTYCPHYLYIAYAWNIYIPCVKSDSLLVFVTVDCIAVCRPFYPAVSLCACASFPARWQFYLFLLLYRVPPDVCALCIHHAHPTYAIHSVYSNVCSYFPMK